MEPKCSLHLAVKPSSMPPLLEKTLVSSQVANLSPVENIPRSTATKNGQPAFPLTSVAMIISSSQAAQY